MRTTTLSLIFTAFALFGLQVCSKAATITWSGTSGGDYETGSNWTGGSAPADDLSTDVAQFTGGTVALTSTRSVGGIDLNSSTTLSGSGTLTVGGSGVTGSGDITLSGSDLTFNNTDGALNFTGDINIGNGNTLKSDRHALKLDTGTHADTTITLDGGTLHGSFNHLDVGGRNFVVTSNGGTLFHRHARNIYNIRDQVISGPGQLTIRSESGTSAGRVELDHAVNTYSGGTRLENGGHARISSDAALGAAGSSVTFNDGNIMAGANVDLGTRALVIESGSYGQFELGNRVVTIRGSISGGGNLNAIGAGTIQIFSSGNTYSGGTMIDNAAIEVRTGGQGFLGTGTITLDNGGIVYGAANNTNMRDTTSIVIGAGGGTLRNAHARALFGLENAVISGDGVLTLDGGGSTNANSRIQIAGSENTLTTGLVLQNAANVQVGEDENLGVAGAKVTIDNARFVTSNGVNYGTREFAIASGGGNLSLNQRTSTMGGPLTGVGSLAIDGASRNYGSASVGGILRMFSTGTLSGDVGIDSVHLEMAANNALGTGAVSLSNGARLKNRDSHTTLVNDVSIGPGGAELMAGWNKSLTLNGAISGSDPLDIVPDSGVVYLNGDSTYTGLLTVPNGGKIGGNGSLDGGLTIDAGGKLAFSTTNTLDIDGVLTIDNSFGIDDLVGISSSTPFGVYTLINNGGDFSHIENFGLENAFDLGDGVNAYFQNGSLQVVVTAAIPEPSSVILAGLFGAGMLAFRRK